MRIAPLCHLTVTPTFLIYTIVITFLFCLPAGMVIKHPKVATKSNYMIERFLNLGNRFHEKLEKIVGSENFQKIADELIAFDAVFYSETKAAWFCAKIREQRDTINSLNSTLSAVNQIEANLSSNSFLKSLAAYKEANRRLVVDLTIRQIRAKNLIMAENEISKMKGSGKKRNPGKSYEKILTSRLAPLFINENGKRNNKLLATLVGKLANARKVNPGYVKKASRREAKAVQAKRGHFAAYMKTFDPREKVVTSNG